MNPLMNRSTLLLVLWFLFSACQKHVDHRLFRDLSPDKTGIHFANNLSNAEAFNMIDYLYYYDGGGVAIGDINNDGLSDIYLVANEGPNALYLNQGNMKFMDISKTAGVESPGLWKTGVSMADVNGDGLLDIYLCRLGSYKGVNGKNQLYINQGDLTFKEEAENYNLDFSGFSTQAAFFDMDNDNDLDVYLLNHSVHSQSSFGDISLRSNIDSLAGDRIYRNDGDYFTDISPTSGIYRSQLGYGLGIALSDINNDGFTDLFIANDFTENDFLYLNNGDATFSEVYQDMADYTSLSSMGCDLADFNNDGLVDIITIDMLPEQEDIRKATVGEDPLEIFQMKLQMGYMPQYKRNMLQLNRGDGTFSDIAMMAGVHTTDWSWAPLFADFDNDGWKDLFVSNGIKGRPNDIGYLKFINSDQVKRDSALPDSVLWSHMPSGKVSNYFYRNRKDLTFEDLSTEWGVVPNLITNGVAYSDLDNDGDLDLVLNNLDSLALIKENTLNDQGMVNYIQLDLLGSGANTKAIGAKIQVYNDGNYQYQELYPVRGFKSSVDYRIHIGLGRIEAVDSLIVTWPGGNKTVLRNPETGKKINLSQSESSIQTVAEKFPGPLYEAVSNELLGVDYVHDENNFIEFNREPILPHMHSREGPALAVADVNQDGLDDFYIGGAKYQEASIYLQNKNGFIKSDQPALANDKLSEDVDAGFLDFDSDGDLDLVVVSGGNEFQNETDPRMPRLYINDGRGRFTKLRNVFQGVYQTGSCVAIYDFDGDGWQDIFLGSLAEPWSYGIAPKSYLLKNENGKSLIDVSEQLPNQGFLGMINDAAWVDLFGNGKKSLVLAGEWMEVTLLNQVGKSFDKTTIPGSSGWWKTVSHMDYDGDGDQDLLLGNMGLNSKIKASMEYPLNLYLEDFDQNGKQDAVMTVTGPDKESIFTTSALLERQIPSIASTLPSSLTIDEASPTDLFGEGLLKANKLSALELRSGVFINNGTDFHFEPFPNIMQISFLRDFLIDDLTGNGSPEILAGGNLYASSMQEGRYAADRGSVISGIPHQPTIIPNRETGISLRGDIRRIAHLDYQGQALVMVAKNNGRIMWFKRK